jgi:hypothetical protein
MSLEKRITHQPKSNREPTNKDIIFSINRLLDTLENKVSTNDEIKICAKN